MLTASFIGQTFNTNVTPVVEAEVIALDQTAKTEVSETSETQKEHSKPKNTKEFVNEYFKDTPILIDVAMCESNIRQFDTDGQVLRGRANPMDVGVMQINEKYHLQTSQKLGMNIYTLEGNLDYAKYLYKTQGTRPWEYSSHCWNKTREVALAI